MKKKMVFSVVGIGASAGGLEAFLQLLKVLPVDTGLAYVFVSHLDPTHKSMLTEILSGATTMPIQEVQDDMSITPDHVYIIPPNTNMAIVNSTLTLVPRTEIRGQHMTIDHFFRSLATDQGNRAIGIILSGAASDGSQGVIAIKEAGGITFAQEEKNAKYESMPHNAIATGSIDFVLSARGIAKELTRISKHHYLLIPEDAQQNDLRKIFSLILNFNGTDFTQYKHATIMRRIQRRMFLHKITGLDAYGTYLNDNPQELEALYNDILITVTNFFRDAEKFEVLRTVVFPAIIKHRPPKESIRIWVPGCSSGEEAYSIAISLLEFLGSKVGTIPIQIFATDLSKHAIEKARLGIYDENITSDVHIERLKRFFVKEGGKYQVIKPIRDMCVFAVHNFVQEPPFSRLDLISCCNVLIYMDSALQQKVLSRFHYALKPTGFLMLGNSETIGSTPDLFLLTDKKNKLYSKKAIVSRLHIDFSSVGSRKNRDDDHPLLSGQNMQNEIDTILLTKYTPASILVNDSMDILEFRGPTSRYLEHPSGQASLNLLKMGPESLLLEIRALFYKAQKAEKGVKKEKVAVRIRDLLHTVTLEVLPLKTTSKPFYLILFEDDILLESPTSQPIVEDLAVQQIQKELSDTRTYLQSIIKEQDAVNEELKVANEEILSSNEELQSINEELETSKEEIQSTNEELITVNEELQNRNEQIKQTRDYAQAIVETIREPLVVLDASLHVRSANSAFYITFKVVPEEVEGKFFYSLGNGQWDIPELQKQLHEILFKRTQFKNFEVEHTFPTIGRKVLLLNARQILHLELILLAMEDITGRKAIERHKEIDRQKDEFIGIASHELRTPVTSIKAFTQVLQNRFAKAGDEKSATLLMKMDTQLDKLTGLIADLLDVTKIETGKLQFHNGYFDFNEVVDEIVEEMQRTTEKHTIVKKLAKTKSIYGDKDRIGQVLLNLLSNAIKYSPESNKIIVKTETGNEGVTLCVQDFGLGLSKENQKKVFERFYRVTGKKQETYPGMGLGLYVSAEIIKRHNGKIWVESTEGKGSTFCFSIPNAVK